MTEPRLSAQIIRGRDPYEVAMTEAEWLTSGNSLDMLIVIQASLTMRKDILCGCACVRRFWQSSGDERSRRAVEEAERFADGLSTDEELERAFVEAVAARDEHLNDNSFLNDAAKESTKGALSTAQACAWHAADNHRSGSKAWESSRRSELHHQADILRDLIGNPFRPATVDPSHRTMTVVQLAQGIYDDRAFDRLQILADALEEAGCTDAAILGHLRGPGPHVRGCWVVDLLLGKE
jgi:hypothetical protein